MSDSEIAVDVDAKNGESRPVTLIFPPLIESNFGSFFPSTAVLSAFLEENGIGCSQEDLNEEFALFLLKDELLGQLGTGHVDGVPEDSLVAAAARWAAKNRDRLIDAQGRHCFGTDRYGADSKSAYVMELIARPFSLDPGPEVLRAVSRDRHPLDAFDQFYRESGIAERISTGTSLIGISVPMGPQLEPSLMLAALLKKSHPETPIVLGGPTLSLMEPDDLATLLRHHPAVDCVVRFDGEHPLLTLARRAVAGSFSPAGIPGVSYKEGDEVVHAAPAPGPNINKLPVPAYPADALDRLADPALAITQARGCYWGKCDYCDFIELYDGSPAFRGRQPNNFVDEIQELVEKFGVQRFKFITESIPPAFARRMSQAIIDRGLNISWNSFAMVDRRFDKEVLGLMVESGCEFLIIGMETTSTRVLKLVNKSADREENLRFLQDARDVGMRLRINLIPNLPSTTFQEAIDTLDDIKGLADCIETLTVFPFEATRSSNVGRNPERFGLVSTAPTEVSAQAQYALNHFHSVDPAMTREELAEAVRLYRAFADEVSRRQTIDVSGPDVAGALRIPVEDIDFLDRDGHVVCTHIGNRERARIPAQAAEFLEPYLTGESFTMTDLQNKVGERGATVLVRNLLKANLLVSAKAPATSASRSSSPASAS
ncbi:B12-binding domain-containing radical SAM protein [Streptomyces sp. NPDC101227]|uniref:B12-binding domain-containing radical SAM protein n=1 Tax=Streptomyces sp. NPDC101227 TaxID=3366136 RepID=UPI0037F7E555